MKFIELLLCEGITANLFAPGACGLQPSTDSGLRSTGLAHCFRLYFLFSHFGRFRVKFLTVIVFGCLQMLLIGFDLS